VVFEREGEQIRIGAMFEPARYGVGALSALVRPNALLLSLAGQMHAEALTPAHRWFAERLDVVRGHDTPETIAHLLGSHVSRSAEHAARLLSVLGAADLGIVDLLLAEPDPLYAGYLSELDGEISTTAKELDSCLTSSGHAARLADAHGVTPVALERELAGLRAARDTLYARMAARRGPGVRLAHAGLDIAVDVADESTATLALLRLLPAVLDALDTGRVLAVDDLDTRAAPGTAERLIRLFREPETNPRGAQLIYTACGPAPKDRRGTAVWELHRTEQGAGELAAR
jgi:hypothetical protein